MEQDYTAVSTNNSSFFSQNWPHILDNVYIRSGLTLVYVLIFLICFLGNLAVILVVILKWKGRLLSQFYLGNLAAANLSVAIFCIPQNLSVYLLDRWIFGELMCKMFHFVTSLCQTASILSFVVVSIERYMTLLHPFRSQPVLTVRRVQVVLLFVWLLSAGVSLPRFFYGGLVRIPPGEKEMVVEICVPTSSMSSSAATDTVYFILFYALPLAALSVMYVHFGAHIRKYEKMRGALVDSAPCIWIAPMSSTSAEFTSHSQMAQGDNLRDPKQISKDCEDKLLGMHRLEIQGSRLRLSRRQKRKSVVRMLASIVVTFALLNLPFHANKFCVNFSPAFALSSDAKDFITGLTFLLIYANCAVNPILYVLMSGRFRRSLRDLVRKFCQACPCTLISL